MPDRHHDAALPKLSHRVHHALHLRREGDDAHAGALRIRCGGPVLALQEVTLAVHGLDIRPPARRGQEERLRVRAALRGLQEGALRVPPEERRAPVRLRGARRGCVRPEEGEEVRIEGPFLCLVWEGRGLLAGMRCVGEGHDGSR